MAHVCAIYLISDLFKNHNAKNINVVRTIILKLSKKFEKHTIWYRATVMFLENYIYDIGPKKHDLDILLREFSCLKTHMLISVDAHIKDETNFEFFLL